MQCQVVYNGIGALESESGTNDSSGDPITYCVFSRSEMRRKGKKVKFKNKNAQPSKRRGSFRRASADDRCKNLGCESMSLAKKTCGYPRIPVAATAQSSCPLAGVVSYGKYGCEAFCQGPASLFAERVRPSSVRAVDAGIANCNRAEIQALAGCTYCDSGALRGISQSLERCGPHVCLLHGHVHRTFSAANSDAASPLIVPRHRCLLSNCGLLIKTQPPALSAVGQIPGHKDRSPRHGVERRAGHWSRTVSLPRRPNLNSLSHMHAPARRTVTLRKPPTYTEPGAGGGRGPRSMHSWARSRVAVACDVEPRQVTIRTAAGVEDHAHPVSFWRARVTTKSCRLETAPPVTAAVRASQRSPNRRLPRKPAHGEAFRLGRGCFPPLRTWPEVRV